MLAAGPVDLPGNAFDLFLLLGQSNMKGRGVVTGSQTPDPHILMFSILQLVDSLREKFHDPELPFIACTIGTFITPHPKFKHTREINDILLRLPELRPFTATVDARDLTGHIGDRLHYDTPSQEIIGERFAEKYREIKKAEVRKN